MSEGLPLGYRPAETASAHVCELGNAALELLNDILEKIVDPHPTEEHDASLPRLMGLQASLFLETARLAIEGHARGRNRAAFGLQSSLFEYLMRAIAYRRGIVNAQEAWHLGAAHCIGADACGDAAAYERWKAENPIARSSEKSFEQMLGELFEGGDGEWRSWIYQRYRRPRLFARGTLGAADDVFEIRGSSVSLTNRSRTIDPDAQVIAIACLACDFVSEFNDHYALGFNRQLEEFQGKISRTALAS